MQAESLLAIDVGAVHTRALLFDVVEGRYRFIATGTAPTTAAAPYGDVGEGVRLALDNLQKITGRVLLGADSNLILPAQSDGSGVDRCVATVSAGAPLRVVLVGLLEEVSLGSARRLAESTYTQVVEMLGLNDHRKSSQRLDAVLRARADLVIIAGGAEGGASNSVLSLLESVGLASYLLPKERRPEVLYAGNGALTEEVKTSLGSLVSLSLAPNIRPTLEYEDLGPSQTKLIEIYRKTRARQMRGMNEIENWTAGRVMPTAAAFGRTIRFIGKEYARTPRKRKPVLGVDLGASATTIAAALGGDLSLSVSHLGMGDALPELLQSVSADEITSWLPINLPADYVQDYIYNKAAYPASLPATVEDLVLEQVLASQILRAAFTKSSPSMARLVQPSIPGVSPIFEPIIAAGSILSHAPKRGQTLMMLLNGLQPVGITTIGLDQNNLAGVLGAAADIAPLLMIQSLDAINFMNLCTVVAPVGQTDPGTTVLRLQIKYTDGSERRAEVKFGSLELIPLPLGQTATLRLQPLHHFDVGMGSPGRGGNVKVTGGLLGLVIDARGRPLVLPTDRDQRRETVRKWYTTLGAGQ